MRFNNIYHNNFFLSNSHEIFYTSLTALTNSKNKMVKNEQIRTILLSSLLFGLSLTSFSSCLDVVRKNNFFSFSFSNFIFFLSFQYSGDSKTCYSHKNDCSKGTILNDILLSKSFELLFYLITTSSLISYFYLLLLLLFVVVACYCYCCC